MPHDPKFVDVGMRVARFIFKKRGASVEVHLSRSELAAFLALAAEKGAELERGSKQ